jgi:alkyl hydroperoxide reductase subunit AhpC
MVKVGEQMPDITLPAAVDDRRQEIRLSDYRGKWLVLFFYSKDATSVCQSEVRDFHARFEQFEQAGAAVLGASADSLDSHRQWLDKPRASQRSAASQSSIGTLKFPLLSDEGGAVSRSLGIFLEEKGIPLRGAYIIDPEGKLRWLLVHEPFVARNLEEVLRVLKALQTGEPCPVGWKPPE